jgi:hypothetical protein
LLPDTVTETAMPPLCGVEKFKVHEPAETGTTVATTGVTAGVGRATVTMRFPPEEQSSVSVTTNALVFVDVIFSVCENVAPTLLNVSAPRLAIMGNSGPGIGQAQAPLLRAHPLIIARPSTVLEVLESFMLLL